jgi:hypothetical protein
VIHFNFLIEDKSGERMLEILLPKILEDGYTSLIKSYKGIGHLPKGLRREKDPTKRVLLNQLPRLIRGFGKAYKGYGEEYRAVLFVLMDLDTRDKTEFLEELKSVLQSCSPRPETYFCLAIEESEAWFLGDIEAIKKAYPDVKRQILTSYKSDSICGTWELLADAIYAGGHAMLEKKGKHEVGKVKSNWAQKITPYMEIDENKSPSFCHFRDHLKRIMSCGISQ